MSGKEIIFHIDVNSAYLSWEAAYRKQHGESIDLRDIPSIVGGDESKRHGIVLAKSIPAKEKGIKTGETIYSAKQKCPDLVIVPPNYSRYIVASNAMIDMLNEYSPYIQQYSIDEAFLGYSYEIDNEYIDVAYEIKDRINNELGFTVNIGIGENKLLAKMASDFKKPNKVHTLLTHEIKTKMWPLPIADLFMVGSRTEAKFQSRGIFTIGDLANTDKDYIYSWLKKPGLKLWEYANGIESSKVRTDYSPIKSISNSTTTSYDVESRENAHLVLLGISEMLGMRIRSNDMCGSVISVYIKDNNFYTYSKQKKMVVSTNSTNTIYNVAKELFDLVWNGTPLRQFSISISELIKDDCSQLYLFEQYNEKQERFDKAIDAIRNRFGHNSVKRLCFVDSGIDPIIGGVVKEETYPMVSKF